MPDSDGSIYDITCLPPEVCPDGNPPTRVCGDAGAQVLDWSQATTEALLCWWSCCKKINVQINGYYSMETTRGLYQQFDTFNDDVPITSPANPCPCGALQKYFYKENGVKTKFTFVSCGGREICNPGCNIEADNYIDVKLFNYTKYGGNSSNVYVQVPQVSIGPKAYGMSFPGCEEDSNGANQRLTYFDSCLQYPLPVVDALSCGVKYKIAKWKVTKKTWTYTANWSWTTCRQPPDPCADCNSCNDGEPPEDKKSNCNAPGSCQGSQGCRSPGTHDKRQTGSVTVVITNTENCTDTHNRCKNC
jgi:hypothetical protein